MDVLAFLLGDLKFFQFLGDLEVFLLNVLVKSFLLLV